MTVLTTNPVTGVAGPTSDPAEGCFCVHCGLPVPRSRRRGGHGAAFCCFGCRFAYGLAQPAAGGVSSGNDEAAADDSGGGGGSGGESGGGTLPLRLGLGVFLAMNVMVFSWSFYSCEWYGLGTGRHDPLAGLFAYLLLLLTTALIAALGVPLAADSWGQLFAFGLRGRVRLDVNALICIGVGAAYVVSVVSTFQGHGSLYYDTAAMILVLVTLGYFLESSAKRKAAGATELSGVEDASRVRVRRGDQELEADGQEVVENDLVFTRAGECLVCDGEVVEGRSHVDESRLTGESRPRQVEPGKQVLAGTVNLDGPLWTRAQRVGRERVIAQTRRLLGQARLGRMPIQRLADRVAAVSVPLVVILAVGVAGWHTLHGQATRGLFDGLCVLLISCPCALGLAAPLAAWSALRRAAEKGVVINSAATLERLAAVDRVFFDKTGTLTQGRLAVHHIIGAEAVDRLQAIRWAAALELASVHPVGRSLVEEAQHLGLELTDVIEAKTLPGLGVQGRVEGRTMRLGSAKLANEHGLNARQFDEAHPGDGDADDALCTRVYLLDDQRVLARFDLMEQLREDAAEAIDQLKRMGMGVEVLSGDEPGPVARVAGLLHVPSHSSLLPAEKLDRISRSRRRGRVAMVGDGINDGPVLAGADVGFAMASGTGLAKQAGHVWLLSDRLDRVPAAIAITRHCMRRVRWNLLWAFGYNAVGLTLAIGGYLTPIVSALAMIASSLMVVVTSQGAGRIDMNSRSREDTASTDKTRLVNDLVNNEAAGVGSDPILAQAGVAGA